VNRRLILTAAALAVLILVGAFSADAQSTEPRFILTGVVFVEGATGGRAWLQEPTLTQNQIITVRRGDSIGPYRLTSIHEDRVEMEGPSGKVVVPLAGVAGPPTAVGPARQAVVPQVGQDAKRQPIGPNQTVDTRTDRAKKFDFRSLPSLLGGNRN
jgi:hypothetical protein